MRTQGSWRSVLARTRISDEMVVDKQLLNKGYLYTGKYQHL